MIKFRYDLIGAYDAGVKIHPQKDIENLGLKVLSYEGVPIGDCVIMTFDSIITDNELPNYINQMS